MEYIENFKREEIFNMYNSRTNPFSFVTTRIDITNIYNLCKVKKHYYATIAYYLTKAMNNVDEFKYRYIDGKIYKCDVIRPSFTDILEDNTIGFYTCEMLDDYDEFLKHFDAIKGKFLKGEYHGKEEHDVVWISCQPWFNFTGVVPPFEKSITIPQLNWDRFTFEGDRCYINLMIMVHHGFADGYHIGKLIENIENIIRDIKDSE
ncbi:MAG: CatA-like O-acetyltransferase [Bacilli bacterium]|nr:CatA-like O-acetyltransferase [Bacilli bacterium]